MRGRWSRRGPTPREAAPWHERDGAIHLARARELAGRHCHAISQCIDPATGLVCLSGGLVYQLACNVPTAVQVRIVFPQDYPQQEPAAYDAEARFPHEADRHFYPDGRCCLWLPPESEWRADAPDALAIFLDQVVVFFDRQFVYDALPPHEKAWPGGERGHGLVGYLEYVRDVLGGDEALVTALAPALAGRRRIGRNKKCPCGGGRKYKKCHMDRVATARRTLDQRRLSEIMMLTNLRRSVGMRDDSTAGRRNDI